MWLLIFIPFCLQALLIGIDEGYFHYKRGLPKWERIGHPLDTFSWLLCLAVTIWVPFTYTARNLYIGCAIFSCLMITKDEFIHKEHCPGMENWLHALLFIVHPITLIAAGMMWPIIQNAPVFAWLHVLKDHSLSLKYFIEIQALLVFLFFVYQVIFWNFVWKKRPVIKY